MMLQNELGYHPYVQPSANLSENYTNPDGISRAACQYCGFCERFGCEYGAKAEPGVTVLPVAKATGNFEIRPHSEVRRILYSNGKATGVLYTDLITGEEFEQPADVVVLSGYVFTNVRLLYFLELDDLTIQLQVLELSGKTMLTKFVKVEQLDSSMIKNSITLLEPAV